MNAKSIIAVLALKPRLVIDHKESYNPSAIDSYTTPKIMVIASALNITLQTRFHYKLLTTNQHAISTPHHRPAFACA